MDLAHAVGYLYTDKEKRGQQCGVLGRHGRALDRVRQARQRDEVGHAAAALMSSHTWRSVPVVSGRTLNQSKSATARCSSDNVFSGV
jgi:hypothetical protein